MYKFCSYDQYYFRLLHVLQHKSFPTGFEDTYLKGFIIPKQTVKWNNKYRVIYEFRLRGSKVVYFLDYVLLLIGLILWLLELSSYWIQALKKLFDKDLPRCDHQWCLRCIRGYVLCQILPPRPVQTKFKFYLYFSIKVR